jgi:hypothetical protein
MGENPVLPIQSVSTIAAVASDQRRKGRKSMSRRSGQKGSIVAKGRMWHIRFYVDVGQTRERRSVPVGLCKGKGKLTRAEAHRKGAEIITSLGVNTAEHLQRATNPITFKQRVVWCRENRTAWTEGKPSSIQSMKSQLEKHILPRFGDLPLHMVDETAVQEFVAYLKRTTFEMRKPKGDLIKTYRLSYKTIRQGCTSKTWTLTTACSTFGGPCGMVENSRPKLTTLCV